MRPIKLGSICAQWGTKKLTDADVFKGVAYENFMMISTVIRHWFLGSIIELSLCKPNWNKILIGTYNSYNFHIAHILYEIGLLQMPRELEDNHF